MMQNLNRKIQIEKSNIMSNLITEISVHEFYFGSNLNIYSEIVSEPTLVRFQNMLSCIS